MKNLSIEINKNPTDILNDTQKKGFIEYEQLIKDYNSLEDNIMNNIIDKDKLNKDEYNLLLTFVILSLYILQSPRRNKDYMWMYILFKGYDEKKNNNKKHNYFDHPKQKFLFFNYKTSKIYNEQIIDVDKKLSKILQIYFAYHPLLKIYHLDDEIPLLVDYQGDPLQKTNSITTILNKWKPYLSSSMIRHIFITYKFDNVEKEKEKIAAEMGHNTITQKTYIKHV